MDFAAVDAGGIGPDDPARDLAEQLRDQGVVMVASRALADSRPDGVDLLGAMSVLTHQVALEWLEASDRLPVLDPDRLQLRSASALLAQAATAAGGDGVRLDALDLGVVARAVSLRHALQTGPEDRSVADANALLDRTWAVLCDLRRLAAGGLDASDAQVVMHVVPSAAQADPATARDLPAALHRAACAGALVGLLTPWLPPPRPDTVAAVDALLHTVSAMARAGHDVEWWAAMATVGRVAASLSVAAGYASASGYAGSPARACAQTLTEPALAQLLDQAREAGVEIVGDAVPAEEDDDRAAAPQASPSQQARAAAERAAAERRATQQAFVERAHATRAAARQDQVPPPRTPGRPPSGEVAPPAEHRDAVDPHGAGDPAGAGSTADLVVCDPTASAAAPHPSPQDPPAGPVLPSLAQVRADLGELEEDEDEPQEINLGVWDTLMRPR